MDFEKCTDLKECNNKIICTSEKKSQFIILNPTQRKINRIKVDGCLIKENDIACDYIFEIDMPMSKVFYLELKGRHIEHAFKQLSHIINMAKVKERHSKVPIKQCYIVTSRSPLSARDMNKYKVTFLKETKMQLIIKNIKLEIPV